MDTAKSADFKLSPRLELRSNIQPTTGTLPAVCKCFGRLDFITINETTVLRCRVCGDVTELEP